MNKYLKEAYLENLNIATFQGVGPFHIPKMRACKHVDVERWITFSQANTYPKPRRARTGVHFYIDDYHFRRVWEHPRRYADLLKQYGAVMSPDFSIYEDFPGAIRIYNVYRNAWLGRYWQECGITVVPDVVFAQDPGADYCWDGYPERSILGISSVGCMDSQEGESWFVRGYMEMMERLDPLQVIFYGKVPDACKGPLVHQVQSYSQALYNRLG